MNLENLTLDELRKLQDDVQRLIDVRGQEELKRAREEILGIAQRVGVSLESLIAFSKDKKQGNKVAAQYRHPDDPAKEWTGRGRQPKWIKEFIEEGGKIDALRITQS